MKLREDVTVFAGCILGLIDGGCTALYIPLPHLLNNILHVLWMLLLSIGGCLYIHNRRLEKHQAQLSARRQRQHNIQSQWVREYEQFRQEIHGKDYFD